MTHKTSLVIWIKEVLRYVPFISYLCNCDTKQKVILPVIDNFSNKDFQANAIEFTLTNTQLNFSQAVLRVRSSLFGLRYLMRQWFFTTALVTISSITLTCFLGFLAFFVVIRHNLKRLAVRISP